MGVNRPPLASGICAKPKTNFGVPPPNTFSHSSARNKLLIAVKMHQNLQIRTQNFTDFLGLALDPILGVLRASPQTSSHNPHYKTQLVLPLSS